MPDDRDVRKPKPAPTGVPILGPPIDDDLTPVNAPAFVIIGKMAERIKEIGSKLGTTGDKLDASIDRDEKAHKELSEGLVGLKVIVAKMDGKLDVMLADRGHEQKLEQIETIAETKLTVIEKKAALEDANDQRAKRRQLWLTFAKTVAKIFGAAAVLAIGAMAGAGLHNC